MDCMVHQPARDLTEEQIYQLRVDLAAAFRLAALFDWHESVSNHFSAAVTADGKKFLLNPRWKHFATIKASDLLLLDADDPETINRVNAPDPSAWVIHGAVHRLQPHVRVLLHCHPTYATALSTLADPTMLPIDNNTARFYGNVAIDLNYGGIANDITEGERIADCLGDKNCLMMGNHGISISANNVAEAFEHLYFFEKAAKTLMLAYATGQPLNVLSDEVAAETARGWLPYRGMAKEHFAYLKTVLDAQDTSYRD